MKHIKRSFAALMVLAVLSGCSYGVAASGGTGGFGMSIGTGLRF